MKTVDLERLSFRATKSGARHDALTAQPAHVIGVLGGGDVERFWSVV